MQACGRRALAGRVFVLGALAVGAALGWSGVARAAPNAGEAAHSVDELVRQALDASPALAALQARVRALGYQADAEASLPSAELALEVQDLPLARPYALDEAGMYMAELRQRLPPLGALGARRRATQAEAEVMLGEHAALTRAVRARVLELCLDYRRADAELALEQAQAELLAQGVASAQARLAGGEPMITELARLELEAAEVAGARVRAEGARARAGAALHVLLGHEDVRAPWRLAPLSSAPVSLPLPELRQRALAAAPSTRGAAARLRAAEARREASELEANVPELMFGVGYWQHPQMRPGFGLSASMSLPWLWGPGAPRVAEAEAQVEAEGHSRADLERELVAELVSLHAEQHALVAELEVLRTQARPAAQRALDTVWAAIGSGREGAWSEALQLRRERVRVERDVIAREADLERVGVRLELLVGESLPRVSAATEETER